jgi:hypothetical protein
MLWAMLRERAPDATKSAVARRDGSRFMQWSRADKSRHPDCEKGLIRDMQRLWERRG